MKVAPRHNRAILLIPLCLFLCVAAGIWAMASSTSARVVFSTGESLYELGLPSSIEEAKVLSGLLSQYVKDPANGSILTELFLLFVLVFITKQTFCIPGSAMLNIIAGAVLSQKWGFLVSVVLTAMGASCCYWLSALLGVALLNNLVEASMIDKLKARIAESRESGSLFFFLLSFRVLPFGPQFLLNLVGPIAGVPFVQFWFATLIGLAPYCYITTGVGALFAEAARATGGGDSEPVSIFTTSTMIQLSLLALAVLTPTLFLQFSKRKDN